MNTLKSRFHVIVNNVESIIDKRYPKLFQLYQRIKTGTVLFTKESIVFYKVRKSFKKTKTFDSFTWKEVQIYKQMPKHFLKITPVFIASIPPLMNYIVFAVAFMFPDKLLTPQFWTLDEKLKIYDKQYKNNLINLRVEIINHLSKNNSVLVDTELKKRFNGFIEGLKNKEQNNVDRILEFEELFIKHPFELHSLSKDHLKDLSRFFNCQSIFTSLAIKRLERYAFLMIKINQLLPDSLDSIEIGDIYKLSFQRGMNPMNKDRVELEKYIQACLKLSSNIFCSMAEENKRKYFSLFLHSVVLSSYCSSFNSNLTKAEF